MQWGYILGGAAVVALIGGGAWYLVSQRDAARRASYLRTNAAGRLSSRPEYTQAAYGGVAPQAPQNADSSWTQDFDRFASGVESLAGAIDRFV